MNPRLCANVRGQTIVHSRHRVHFALSLAVACLLGAASVNGADEASSTKRSVDYAVTQVAGQCCPKCGNVCGRGRRCPTCQPYRSYGATEPGVDGAAPGAADDMQERAPDGAGADDLATPDAAAGDMPMDSLASNFGAASAPQSSSPFMIGDSFGGGSLFVFLDDPTIIQVTDVPRGGGTGPMKICENSSPLPRCRAFVNYHFFANAIRSTVINGSTAATDLDVQRYTFGWEQCFADGLYSVELRAPFARTIGSDQELFTDPEEDTEFGHLTVTFKGLLHQTDTWATSIGLSVNTPTANNFRVFDQGGGPLLFQVDDESAHLQPFLGYLATPNDRLFFQAFAQLDIDTRGNDVFYADSGSMQRFGTVQDQTLLYLDASIGYWLYHNPGRRRGISGIAPMFELHYTTTLEDADIASGAGGLVQFGNVYNRLDVLNATAGITLTIGDRSTLTFAGSAPMDDFPDRFFDGEGMILYNWMF